MNYCAPRGIPHSVFLSWDELDRDKALEWLARDRSRCPGCGTPPVDWDEERDGDREAYRAELVGCLGCLALSGLDAEGEKGSRKQLIPNGQLQMWGGPFLSSTAAREARGDGLNERQPGRVGADAGDAS